MNFQAMLDAQRSFMLSGQTRDVGFRKQALRRLLASLQERENALLHALILDLGKAGFEGYATELSVVKEEILFALRRLGAWARPRKAAMPAAHFPSHAHIAPEPKGCVLIFSPWNYPLQLALVPLVAAIAAGNCAMLKPSRHSAATSRELCALIAACFPPEYILAAEGGESANEELLSLHFDHIFFTGSPRVGRIVMAAAAQNLTPVTLELGGKSPVIVDESADISVAARRIAWGKALNAGQTCVAPDYLLVHEGVKDQLCEDITKSWKEFFGDNPLASPDLARIVSRRHYNRLKALLEDGRALCGGSCGDDALRIAPTLLANIREDSALLSEEIFGPILPVIPFRNTQEALAIVRGYPTPLALYLFARDRALERHILSALPFGGGCVNDVVIHLANPRLPFGGLGESGMGAYHGKWGFDALSHYKAIVKKHSRIDIRLRYPPYKDKLALLKRLIP